MYVRTRYHLISACTEFQAKLRPKFREIITLLLPDLPDTFSGISYFHSKECTKATPKENTSSNEDLNITTGVEITEDYHSERAENDQKNFSSSIPNANDHTNHETQSNIDDGDAKHSLKNFESSKLILNSLHGSSVHVQNRISSYESIEKLRNGKDRNNISKSLPCMIITDNRLSKQQLQNTFTSTSNI